MRRLLLSLALLGCGGAQTVASAGAEFTGPNELDFLVTEPVRRQMPPERHRGSAVVVSDDGAEVVLELRMIDGGDVCRITATRQGEAEGPIPVTPTQCASSFVYEGSPTATIVQIEQGTVTHEARSLSVELSGEFVANVQAGDSVNEVRGVARWSFEGTR